jgi:PIN domain nuclease of toxin-antitoxin system
LILIDTHVLIWLVQGDERLGLRARAAIAGAAAEKRVRVAAISAWEVALLARKGRVELGRDTSSWLEAALAMPGIALAPLDPAIAAASVALPGDLPGDPADRFIVATARHHDWSLMTADAALLAYGAAGYVNVVDARRW